MIGKIKKVITSILKGVYSVLCVFNLQFALLVALVGVVLHFTGVLSTNGGVLIGFCGAFIASILLAVILTVRKLLGLGKPKEDKPVQIVSQVDGVQGSSASQSQPIVESHGQENLVTTWPAKERPVYYLVKQNQNYVMAEYSDRYELFEKTPNGLKRIRTDFKG